MKIEEVKTAGKGQPLNSFKYGDCIRLVGAEDGFGGSFVGCVYIVAAVSDEDGSRAAVSLSDGYYRKQGRFMLEPSARVVIE